MWAQGIAQSKTKVITKTKDVKPSATLTLGTKNKKKGREKTASAAKNAYPHGSGPRSSPANPIVIKETDKQRDSTHVLLT